MREAARALDDVSDHLGEVLRRADELLVEWSTFAAQVRGQVEREAAAVGHIVEGAVGRVAAQGIDRAISDRLRALTLEIERLEQRARAASRAVVEQRDQDRRILWAVVAGIVLANALLVVLLLRKPAAVPAAEPIRLDSTSAPQSPVDPAQGPAAGAAPTPDPTGTTTAGSAGATGSAAPASGSASLGAAPGSNAPSAGSANPATAQSAGTQQGAAPQSSPPQGGTTAPGAAAKAAPAGSGAAHTPETAAPRPSPMAYPPRPGVAHPHKKLP
jgi:hypothetical protein